MVENHTDIYKIGDGKALNISAADGSSSGTYGGSVTITAGSATVGDALGGGVSISAGNGAGTGGGGFAGLIGGNGVSGGQAYLQGGDALSGNNNGGTVALLPGGKSGSGADGYVFIEDYTTGKDAKFDTSKLTSHETYTFPNQSGLFMVPFTDRANAQTGAVSLTAVTVGSADSSYLVSSYVLVTTSTNHNFTVTCTYTDETNTSRTLTLSFSRLAGTYVSAITNVTGVGPYEGIPLHIRAKAGTTITIASVGTFTTVTYNIEGAITRIA